jgi:hypothetical protein
VGPRADRDDMEKRKLLILERFMLVPVTKLGGREDIASALFTATETRGEWRVSRLSSHTFP